MKFLAPAAAALTTLALAAPASATDVEFASYTSIDPGTFKVSTTAHGATAGLVTVTETKQVDFSFLTTNLAPTISGVVANVTFTATGASTDFFKAGGYAFQGLDGTYDFTSTAAYTVGNTTYAAGSHLLTVAFTGGTLVTKLNTTTGNLAADSGSGTVTYASDFLTFSNLVGTDFSVGITGINPKVPVAATFLPAFTGSPNGGFSSDPGPQSNAVVPEPATWAMMLFGMGAIGLGLRGASRKHASLRAA